MKKDNSKWPLIGIGIIGFIFLSLGVLLYIKKQSFLGVAIASFMGLSFIYVLISEIIYRKKSKIIINEKIVSEKTIIKQSLETFLLNFLGNLAITIFGVYLIYISEFSFLLLNFNFSFLIGLLFVAYYGFLCLKNVYYFFYKKKHLILSNRGIEFNQKLYSWSEIKNERIIEKEEYSNKYTYMMQYFSFRTKGNLHEFKLEDYHITDTELVQLLKIYRNRTSKKTTMNTQPNDFESILNYEEYLDLSLEEGEKYLKKIREIAEEKRNEIESYLITSTINSTSQHSLIYSALTEDFQKWKTLLSNEFIRLFEQAKKSSNYEDIFEALDEILPDDCPNSEEVKKVVYYLYNELNNSNKKIRHKAIWYISFWLDEDNYHKFPEIINRIKEKLNDNYWKIRWMANNVLMDYPNVNREEIKLNFWDKIKSKYGNPYSID